RLAALVHGRLLSIHLGGAEDFAQGHVEQDEADAGAGEQQQVGNQVRHWCTSGKAHRLRSVGLDHAVGAGAAGAFGGGGGSAVLTQTGSTWSFEAATAMGLSVA